MIDALFNDPNYLAGKKTLDAIALREQAIASNIANLETPGYQRVDLAPSFKAELDRACASGDAQEIAALKPGLAPDTTAVPMRAPVGPALKGRVLDGLGQPLDSLGPVIAEETVNLHLLPPHPLKRQRTHEVFETGIKAIDTFSPCGRGQRLGIFSGSGVGKFTLLGMMASHAEADVNDPIADAVRSILDGHIVLTRELATQNHYPAIDVLESISRLNRDLLSPEQLALAAAAREHLAVYPKNQALINIGAYPAGTNPAIDQAIALHEPLNRFLRQGMREGFRAAQCWSLLEQTISLPAHPAPTQPGPAK